VCSAISDAIIRVLSPRIWEQIRLALAESRAEIYLVGGAIRDFLMNRQIGDIDFVVSGRALPVAHTCAQRLHAAYIPLDPNNDIARVVCQNGLVLDFSGMRGQGISDDLACRDFSINAIAMRFPEGEMVDLFDGVGDIQHQRISMIGSNVFVDDPLRLLRAFRFSALLRFRIAEPTLRAISTHAAEIVSVSGERIWYEWERIITGIAAPSVLTEMFDAGIMPHLFPWITSENAHFYRHFVTVVHSYLSRPPEWFRDRRGQRPSDVGDGWLVALVTGSLLCPEAKARFSAAESAATWIMFLSERYHLSTKLLKRLEVLSNNRGAAHVLLTASEAPGKLTIFHYAQGAGLASQPLLLLVAAWMTTMDRPVAQHVEETVGTLRNTILPFIAQPPLLRGQDLIRMGFIPGPRFQQIFQRIREGQITGEVTTVAEAESLAQKLWCNETL